MKGSGNPPSIKGSKSVLYPEQMTFSDKTRFTPSVDKIFLFLVVLFFIATVVFTALFAIYYTKYEDKYSCMCTSEASSTDTCICSSPDCVVSASMMIKKMNLQADPCQDFSEYACGRFIDNAVLPEGRTEVGTISVVYDKNQQILKSIIEAEAKPGDPKYLNNMKNLYNSCMDEDQIEAVGLAPYMTDADWVNDWPTLNSAWDPASFNLIDLIVKYEKVYIEVLYTYSISTDMKDSTKKALSTRHGECLYNHALSGVALKLSSKIDDGALSLKQEYFRRARNDSVLKAYETYLTEVAVALGANRTVAEKDSRDIVDLQRAIAEIMVPRENRRDNSKNYNPTTLMQLDAEYPELGIARAVRAAFATANVTLPDDEFVINSFPTYLGNLSAVLGRFENRIIQNMYGSVYARSKVQRLTLGMRKIYLDFEKVYRGKKEESPRWQTCLGRASRVFWKGMSQQYITRAFLEDAKTYMNQMIDNLKSEFRAMLEENPWMSEPTKNEAYVKLTKMNRKIGYPDHDFSEQDIEDKYSNHTMTSDHYYNNKELIKRLSNLEGLVDLRKPVDKNKWRMSPFKVNAYFARSENEIVFPAGILQPPFFSQTAQDAMNYGAIGVVIGHEITHGFDDRGSQYDGDGVLRNWWQKEDRERFLARTKCVVDQFSNFHVDHVNMSLRGINVQGESIADLGGVKESFRAYKRLVKEKGEQPTLPGLGLTPDQVFFLSYGQIWCEKLTPQRWVRQILTAGHPPSKYRIIGALQNIREFAQAFKCPAGSYMNPRKKCTVW